MKRNLFRCGILTSAFLLTMSGPLCGQATWVGGGAEPFFDIDENWLSGSAPTSGAFTVDASGLIVFNYGAPYAAASVTINAGVSTQMAPNGVDSLNIGAGGLVMNGVGVIFDLPVVSTANSSWFINSGSVSFGNVFDVSVGVLTFDFAPDTTLSFGETPEWTGGGINFIGTVTASTIEAGSINPANLSKITINGAAVQISNGFIVSAIPEPATWAVMLGGTALFMVVGRRRRRTAA